MLGPQAVLSNNRGYQRLAVIAVACIVTFYALRTWAPIDSRYNFNGYTIGHTADTSLLDKVWQIFLDPVDHDPNIIHMDAIKASHIPLELTGSWLPVDGGWDYHFLGTDRADGFVRKHFSKYPDIIKVFTELKRPVVRGDFMRYLAVCAEGGVFSDYDTQLKKPLQKWVPEEYRDQTRAIIGIEYDRRDGELRPDGHFGVSFVQYTFAAAKWHPIMLNMALNLTGELMGLSEKQGKPIGELSFKDKDVLKISGPVAFTQIVYDHIGKQLGRTMTWQDFSKLDGPKLFGDTLILTINGFGAGQTHSGSNDSSPDVLVRHMFNGGWRGGKDKNSGHTKPLQVSKAS